MTLLKKLNMDMDDVRELQKQAAAAKKSVGANGAGAKAAKAAADGDRRQDTGKEKSRRINTNTATS